MTRQSELLNTFCGSPYYAPPEMNQGIRYLGPQADTWSLGIIFYACLTSALPFSGQDLPTLYRNVRRGLYMVPDYVDLCTYLPHERMRWGGDRRATTGARAVSHAPCLVLTLLTAFFSPWVSPAPLRAPPPPPPRGQPRTDP